MIRLVLVLALMGATGVLAQRVLADEPVRAEAEATKGKAAEESEQLEEFTPPQAQRDIEQKVLAELNKGRQKGAEDLLSKHVETIPEIETVLDLISQEKKAEAYAVVEKHAKEYRNNQRLIYWHAACIRSRFEIEEAHPFFIVAVMANDKTAFGQSAFRIVMLEASKEVQTHPDATFATLEKMVAAYPDEIAMRWMLAVQYRNFDRPEAGVVHYKKILEKWNPGPVLVHQTYANLLDGLKRYEESLVERRKAVELEPAGWSYDGLGTTLDYLKRFDEASKAHAEAVKLDPKSGHYLGNWAHNALKRKQYDEAIEKSEQATKLDPSYGPAWYAWGKSLDAQGKSDEALKKYRQLLENVRQGAMVKLLVSQMSDDMVRQTMKELEKRWGDDS